MTESGPTQRPGKLRIRDIEVGETIETSDGLLQIVTENPKDGIWLIASDPSKPEAEPRMVMATDIRRVVPVEGD